MAARNRPATSPTRQLRRAQFWSPGVGAIRSVEQIDTERFQRTLLAKQGPADRTGALLAHEALSCVAPREGPWRRSHCAGAVAALRQPACVGRNSITRFCGEA